MKAKIKKTELRIGNQILIDGNVTTVDERTLFYFDHDGRVKEGVKLTNDVLLRLGFKRESKYDFVLKKHNFEIEVYNDPVWDDVNNGTGTITYSDGIGITFKYLHNLQNLYYALTGEELTLKQQP